MVLERIKQLCKENHISQRRLEQDLNLGNGATSKWATSAPSFHTLSRVAEYFGVSVDYLQGKSGQQEKVPILNQKDEQDIAKRIAAVLADLENGQEGLAFSGEPLDEVTRELLVQSLRNSMEIGKTVAKQKFTPKRYREGEK